MTTVSEYPPDYCACGKKAPECGGFETFCWSCNEHEERPDDVFVVCFECNHVYPTRADLEHSFAEHTGFERKAADIFACPLCVHDF